MMKHWWQRRTRGFDDSELWSLDSTIASFIAPRLRAYADSKRFGYPCGAYPEKWTEAKKIGRWEEEVEIMARAFEILRDEDVFMSFDEDDLKTVEKGLKLFAKRFHNLWD
jgi:hypothetical protein